MLKTNDILLKQINSALESDSITTDELKELLRESRYQFERFDKIITLSDKQLMQQVHKQEEEFELRLHSEHMLAEQSKHAALGEMMDAVAHQWKQPLNAISMMTELLLLNYEDGSLDREYLIEHQKDMFSQIEHMLTTLNVFRSFFRPSKDMESCNVLESMNSVLLLMKDELLKNEITVNVTCKEHIEIKVIKNEFKHILLNILNNAKDAFIEKDIKNRVIDIDIVKNDSNIKIEISDNAGGIPKDILQDIFKANVTSKENGKGTGIGLYMSKKIADKMSAQLTAKNIENGAVFTLRIPL
jgi:signal transduction histidine kinase